MSNWLHSASKGVRHAFMLTREEEEAAILAMQKGCKKSFEQLVRAHERLVLSCANYYSRFGTDRSELISEGRLGLVIAIQHFEPKKGARLNTYAAWWIKACMRRFSVDNRRVVKPPHTRGARQVISNLRWFEAKHLAKTGREPTAEEAAIELDVLPRDIEDVRSFLGSQDKAEDYITRRTDQTPEQILIERERNEIVPRAIEAALAEFNPRTQTILRARLLQDEPARLAELGLQFGLCRERIRQIERGAMAEFHASVAAHLAALRSKRAPMPESEVRGPEKPKRGRPKSKLAKGSAGSRTSTTCSGATLD